MSTYNGAEYLHEQVISILNQKGVDITLYIRDDGSTDIKTLAALEKLSEENRNIQLIRGENLGVVKSFFELMILCSDNHDFYAFADQDDVWLDDKLLCAATSLQKLIDDADVIEIGDSVPAMYYSRLEFVDKYLNHLGFSPIPHEKGFHNALVQNQATGCTVVLNKSARNLISQHLPDWSLMHDWWCYLVVSAFGLIYYDDKPRIKYRKHGNNVTPATPHFFIELYARTRRFLGENDIPEKVTDQAREFNRIFDDKLNAYQSEIINGLIYARSLGVYGRLHYALRMPVARNTPIDNLIMRLLIVFGRF